MNTRHWAIVLTLFVTLAVEPMSLVQAASGTQFGMPTALCQSCPAEHLLNADGTLNLNTGWSGALDPRGWQVVLDAERGPLFEPAGSSPATPSANAWMALGTGMNSSVNGIAVSGSDVYVGGNFTSAGGVLANHIAKWDGSAWSALGMGTNSFVEDIVVSGSDVYVAADFTSAGGVAANHIAKWDGSAWSALGTGLRSIPSVPSPSVAATCMWAVTSPGLAASQQTISPNGTEAHGLRWALGPINSVDAIAVDGSDVYVGGFFTSMGGVAANNIAKWDGSVWSALGTGTSSFV